MPERRMETLRNSRDFRRVIEGGTREILETITAYRLPNREGKTRVGITVSKKAGGSITRNRIKRRIREAVRRNTPLLPTGEDVVIMARRGIASAAYGDIEDDIRGMRQRSAR